MTRDHFDLIREKYGYYSSWAIWADADGKPKSNIGDLHIFDVDTNPSVLSELKPHIVFVGLNISRGLIHEPLANFHDSRPRGTDFKIRHALKGTEYWGAYMTDLFKDLDEKDSKNVQKLVKNSPSLVDENINFFRQEIADVLGEETNSAMLIAFGNEVYSHLSNHFRGVFCIEKVPHYAAQKYNNKEEYRRAVLESLARSRHFA